MAPKSGSVLKGPRTTVEIAQSIKSCRDLVRVADAQLDKAKSDWSIARLRLAEIELELTSRDVRSADPDSNREGQRQ